MRSYACRRYGARGGVFVSPAPAYADGYVDGTGNNIYYGFKTDAQYAEAHFNIDVEYYDTFEHAKKGGTEGIDPLGKYVRVHYLSNSKNQGVTADEWKFRPMWWFGVPAGLKDPQDIQFKRIEKLTKIGNQKVTPAGSSQQVTTDANGYGVVSDKHFNNPKQWNNISNYYFSDQKILASKGWKQLMGLDDKGSKGYDDKGNTAQQWGEYQKQTQGLKGIFVDWESAGQRWYDMTYVSEMEDTAWKERDKNPLRFAAGVYRFAGNWHYAVGQKHNTPRIADNINLKYPELTPVKDLKNVSTDEQNAIKDKIATANKDTKHYSDLVDKVEVSDKGVATITFKDKSTRTISADLLVFKNEEDKDKYKPIMPARTPVVNPSKLTDDDKKAVIAAFKDANKDNKDFNEHVKADPDGIKFNDDGTKLVVTYQDGSQATIDASELVCQGATIADWAPYVVPDTIEVDDLKKLKQDEINNIIKAFDDANTGITPYDEAKNKNADKKAPVTVDPKTGNATITWEDGSTTTISAWQFLKEKPKQNPEPSTPTQQGDKTFIVEAPKDQKNVNFDPFNAKDTDLTDANNIKSLNSIKEVLKACAAKDAKDNKTPVTIKDVEFKIADGKGVVVFHADNYKDATYPMSVFLKQMANKQTPKETEHNPQGMTQYKYKVKPVEYEGTTASVQDWMKALKQFVKSNYGTDLTNDAKVTESYSLKEGDNPVSGTSGLTRYVNGQNKNAGIVTISLSTNPNDGSLVVQGFETGDTTMKTLFTVPAKELYVKKGVATDHTLSDLKQQAKDLLKKRTDEGLTKDDLKRAGITDADKLDNNAINGMDEKALRDLIRKLTDAKKAERKYNSIPEIEVTDPANPSEADFKKAVEAFLKANYDGTDSLAGDKAPYTVPTGLTPKKDTALMELASDTNTTGISSITYANSDLKTLIFKDKNNNQLFTVSVKYKKKTAAPAPTPDALAQMKKDAEQQIDRNPNLTKEQKEDYKKQIGQAQTPDAIKTILKAAADKGKENQSDPSKSQTITDNKGGGNAKKEAEDKKQKEEEKQKEQKLQEDKKKAKEALNSLTNLTDGDSGDKNKLSGEIDKAKTPEDVQKILEKAKAINDARGALKEGALPFLSHGNANSDDDKALKELIGADITKKDSTLTALETALAKTNPAATTDELNKAVTAAKQANARNEQAAKDAANKQLTEKKDALDNAYNALTDQQKQSAKDKYEAATKAIDDAKATVNKATKPSDIKTAVDNLKTSFDTANKAIEDAKGKRDTTGNTNDSADELTKEKEAQKKRIQDSDLPDTDKQKAIDDINNAKKLGDPTGIADRALKAQKIKDAKKQIAALDHLNDAQKKAYEDIINSTDAHNIKDDDGKDTGKDDIDNALADAIATDHAMERLEKLKEIADTFANGEKYKSLQDSDDKKKAFNTASTAAGAVLAKETGDAKTADQVNELYKDLLNAMQAIDDKAKGAGVITDALQAEVDKDSKLKPTQADPQDPTKPATPGDPIYNTSSQEKKQAFDQALTAAENALKTAKDDNANQQNPNATPRTPEQEAAAQKAVDEALKNLQKAREELDGVDTKPLQDEIGKDSTVNTLDRYTYSTKEKKDAFDQALQEAKDLIDKLTGKKQAGTDDHLDTKENKQKALDKALAKLKAAEEALKGKKPVEPTPTPTPTPSVDKSHLQQGIDNGSDVHNSDEYNNAPSDKKQAYDHALDHANEVNNNPNATQDQVNQAAEDLKKAENDLKPTPSPLPTPVPGGHEDSGFGVNDNAPTTVDKGELNVQIDSAEADSQPGNAGAGNAGNAGNANAGNTNSGNANAANANNANGANSAAVNAAVESNPAVKQADAQVSKAQAALDAALAEAKKVAADPNATQAQVDAAAQKLSAARKALASAKAHAAEVRASVRAQVLKSGVSQLSKTGSNVSVIGLLATVAAAGAAFFVSKRRGISRHSNN